MEDTELAKAALEARKRSYCPYSKFAVGAALLTKDGRVFKGCNIENAAFSPSVCAERVAFAKAVSEGFRDFSKIAIAGGAIDASELELCPPCGVCRQVMSEFCGKEFEVILVKLVKNEVEYEIHTLGELLPLGFSL